MGEMTYAVLGSDGWEHFDNEEEWQERSMELMEQRDMSQFNPPEMGDAMEW